MKRNEEIEKIFAFLSDIRPLSESCKAYLRKVIHDKKYAKKETLLKIGEVNQNLYFIFKGALSCFHMHEGKEVYDWFFFETETVVSTGSFHKQVPSVQCIQAEEDTEVYYISRQDYEYLKYNYLEFAYIVTVLQEKYIDVFGEHAMLIRDHSPVEKHQQLLAKMPQLVLRIDGKKLATWMDMHPSTLSRTRNERA